jgi:Tfp pilus assembly protein PilZ
MIQSPTSEMGGGARPGVLSLSIKEKSALFAAYMPFVKGGGLFIPTNKTYKMGEEVYMLLSLMEDPGKIPVSGKVIWISPQGAHGGSLPPTKAAMPRATRSRVSSVARSDPRGPHIRCEIFTPLPRGEGKG